jgi:hypothetical protein
MLRDLIEAGLNEGAGGYAGDCSRSLVPVGWLYASSGEGRLRLGDNLWPGALRRRSRLIVCGGDRLLLRCVAARIRHRP